MDGAWSGLSQRFRRYQWYARPGSDSPAGSLSLGGPVEDLAYIGLTILVFGVLWLLVKGVERFER